jgi:hypothetical protein
VRFVRGEKAAFIIALATYVLQHSEEQAENHKRLYVLNPTAALHSK